LLTIAGAGMAGLVASVRLRELGVRSVVLEKGNRVGGSMLLSSGVVWRYRDWGEFRRQCAGGEEGLQRLVWERLDDALDWLESLGAPVVERETGNALTVGRRFDTRGLTDALACAAGELRIGEAFPADAELPVILATGGFQGDPALVAEHVAPAAPLPVRANSWSSGEGLRFALARGARLSSGLDEFYGRNMPDRDFGEDEFVTAAQLYAHHALVLDEYGEQFLAREPSWSETDVVQATARRANARAWYVLTERALDESTRYGTVRELAERSRTSVPARDLSFDVPRDAVVAVRVRASITHTIGGVRVDEHGRAADGVWVAGVDAGGISTGGYASGLAQALVLGLAAAEDVAARA
jgi:succinate dehydrogenase/fumarate reductase flavoprotein subunit